MNLKDLIKTAAPVALSAFAPGIGQALMPGMNPMLQKALISGIGSVALGGKPKDALLSAALGGGLGYLSGGAGAAATPEQKFDLSAFGGATGDKATEQIIKDKVGKTVGGAGFGALKGTAPLAKGDGTMSGGLLKSLGIAGEDEGNLLFKLLNSQLGEGLAAGLVAQLLAGDEEDEVAQGSFQRRPFGAGGPGGQLGGINYADGGEAYFPRRNGGIDPSEGSGTKDDVPALLLAGEFVHTRDANEGLGKMMGAKNKDEAARMGIEAQYKLMDAFERMA
jgi:hypothetical protein